MPILRGTNSAQLPCGCLIGLYETYRGRTIAIIDLKGSSCTDRPHRVNAQIPWSADTTVAPDRTIAPSPLQDSPHGAQQTSTDL